MVLRKLRNLCALGLAGAMFCGTMFSVTAISPRDLFDAKYYAEQNPDVVAAYGDDAEALYKHYSTYGVKEGRSLSPVFDVKSYRERYSDLEAAFGDDWSAYMNHMVEHGLCEDRYTVDKNVHSLTAEQALTIYAAKINARIEKEGVEAVLGDFDTEAYKAANPDVATAFGNNTKKLIEHYLEHGIKEGRASTEDKSKDPVVAIQKNPTVVAYVTDFSPEAIVEKAEEIRENAEEKEEETPSYTVDSAKIAAYVSLCYEMASYYKLYATAENMEDQATYAESYGATYVSFVAERDAVVPTLNQAELDAIHNVYETCRDNAGVVGLWFPETLPLG